MKNPTFQRLVSQCIPRASIADERFWVAQTATIKKRRSQVSFFAKKRYRSDLSSDPENACETKRGADVLAKSIENR